MQNIIHQLKQIEHRLKMLGTDQSSNLISDRLSSFNQTELNTNIDQDKAKQILVKLLHKTDLNFNSNIFEINETIANKNDLTLSGKTDYKVVFEPLPTGSISYLIDTKLVEVRNDSIEALLKHLLLTLIPENSKKQGKYSSMLQKFEQKDLNKNINQMSVEHALRKLLSQSELNFNSHFIFEIDETCANANGLTLAGKQKYKVVLNPFPVCGISYSLNESLTEVKNDSTGGLLIQLLSDLVPDSNPEKAPIIDNIKQISSMRPFVITMNGVSQIQFDYQSTEQALTVASMVKYTLNIADVTTKMTGIKDNADSTTIISKIGYTTGTLFYDINDQHCVILCEAGAYICDLYEGMQAFHRYSISEHMTSTELDADNVLKTIHIQSANFDFDSIDLHVRINNVNLKLKIKLYDPYR